MAKTGIDDIRSAFMAEAKSAPSLFADLAKVELYIAESYRTRALIELLQNADDAGATTVRIAGEGKRLIIANDGRTFTAADVEALCRSGASNKQRGSGSIGYRGIGFKSVAGLAKEVIVLSGAQAFCYSKKLTRHVLSLKGDVPLIRIPHPLEAKELAEFRELEKRYAPAGGTVFVLTGLDLRALTQEVEDLTPDVLIFLNHVRKISIQLDSYNRTIGREVTGHSGPNTMERISEGETSADWLVRRGKGCERVALLLEGKTIVPVPQEKAVIHAFLPTQEFSGAYLKLNGDFSTDPSRKAVDLDAASEASLRVCIEMLWQMLEEAVADAEHEGIFSTLKPASSYGSRVAGQLKKSLVERLGSTGLPLPGGEGNASSENIRLAPAWLNYGDYEALCSGIYRPISAQLLASHPDLPDALRWMEAKTLTLEEALRCTETNPPSPVACAQLWTRAAKQMRFDLTDSIVEWLASLPLLPDKRGNMSPARYSGEKLAPEFTKMLLDGGELDDVRFLLKKLGGDSLSKLAGPPAHAKTVPSASIDRSLATAGKDAAQTSQRSIPAIQYWRSAEKNADAWFSAQPNVLSVRDVSQANVGYDLLVVNKDGSQMHVEVKSVKHIGDPFRMTNNEHATAYQDGEAYVLAIVVNAEPFEVCLINDPIRHLSLEKRCEQWSWYAENYDSHLALKK